MSAEQTQPTSTSKGTVKTILLVVLAIMSLLFFVFGFIQKLEADKQSELANMLRKEAETAKNEALVAQNDAESMAMAAREEADKQRALAEEALVACEKSKKK